jgi:integrase/recombinase XerD
MNLRNSIDEYLLARRALGYKLRVDGWLLSKFADHCERTGITTVTTEAALAWAQSPAHASPSYWRQRLTTVRRFATYLQALDPAVEVPPTGLVRVPNQRAVPFLYSEAEIAALMAAARGSRKHLGAATYEALFGLLAVTGLRVGEALRLDRDDVCWEPGLLRVRDTKFGKSREVPLHPSTLDALRAFARRRDRRCPKPTSAAFFVSSAGTRLHYSVVLSAFTRCARRAGLVPRGPRCRPRIHDLRHAFAVRTLLRWHREGLDVESHMPLLSTYLGHADPRRTYWYLSATPELFALLGERLEKVLGDLS